MTPTPDLHARLLRPLQQADVPYTVTGEGRRDRLRRTRGELILQADLDRWIRQLGLETEWQRACRTA